ncbi:Carbohydrate esterase 4 protein [Myotisia sp. PD_48]|nr:Carbohydrate esterase 4 protein [Myotisia sp. PD_48]
MIWSSLAGSLLLGLTAARGIPTNLQPRADIPAGSIIRTCATPGVMALTFDDGPFIYTTKLLDQLEEADIKATFFINGDNYACIYNETEIINRAYQAGHQIASHTWSHADLRKLDEDGIKNEMSRLEVGLSNVLGIKPTYMRPPFGSYNQRAQDVLAEMGYRIIMWDVDTGDSIGRNVTYSKKQITDAGTSGDGHVVLMHDPIRTTPNQLVPWVLQYAQEHELRLVTVAECLDDVGNEYTDPVPQTDEDTCTPPEDPEDSQ